MGDNPMREDPQLHLLVAPPAGGKTNECIGRVRQAVQAGPLSVVWAITRDSRQAAAFRQRLAYAGGALGARVATFQELYEEILSLSGSTVPTADEAVLHRLARAAVDEVYERGGLHFYAPIRATPGFVLALRDRFAELKRSLVLPERFQAIAEQRGDPALHELARIYAAYQRRLAGLGWADTDGLSWLAFEALERSPDLLRGWSLVVVDGFDSFNPTQRRTLAELTGRVDELLVTLPGAPAMDRAAHRRFGSTLHSLRDSLGDRMVVETLPGGPRAHLPSPLDTLEAGLFEPGGAQKPPGEGGGQLSASSGSIALIEARSPEEEAREALRWLKAAIVRDSIAPPACAVLIPDDGAYHAALQAASAEFGVPVRFSQGERLNAAPAVAALTDLLVLPLKDWPLRPLLDSLRSPYLDFSVVKLERADAALLELAARWGQVVEGRAQWQDALERLAGLPDEDEPAQPGSGAGPAAADGGGAVEPDEEGVALLPRLPRGEQAARLLNGLRELWSLLEVAELDRARPELSRWTGWLDDLLRALHFYDQPATDEERGWVEAFKSLLDSLARSEALTGPRPYAYADFFSELEGLLTGARISPRWTERGAASVAVFHIYEARGLRFQAAAVLGLAEGSFPSVVRADPLFSEAVRVELDMEPLLNQEQAGVFYQAVARAGSKLLLTRPYLAKDGETWEPSPYWNAVLDVLKIKPVQVRPDDLRPLSEAASPAELLFWAARSGEPAGLPEELAAQLDALRLPQKVLLARQSRPARGAHEGGLADLSDRLSARYGSDWIWSASRIEAYATCPFNFFATNALGLEPQSPPKAGLVPRQIGSVLHEILETAYGTCPEPDNPHRVLECLHQVAGSILERAPEKYGFRPNQLWEAEKAELIDRAEQAVRGLAEIQPQAGWKPAAFELRFGGPDQPALILGEGPRAVRLRGVIDRIDMDRDGRLRVVDYKTGSSHLAKKDLQDGRRVQLPIYAMAVEQALRLGLVVEGLYWVLSSSPSANKSTLKLSEFGWDEASGPPAAYEVARQHVERITSSIQNGDFQPDPPAGGCPSYCAALTWCWRYQPPQR